MVTTVPLDTNTVIRKLPDERCNVTTNNGGDQPEPPSDDQVLAEYLAKCLPTRWLVLWNDAPEGVPRERLRDLLFDKSGVSQDWTLPGIREHVATIVMKSSVLQELLWPEAQDFWEFRRQYQNGPPDTQAVMLHLLEAFYRVMRPRGGLRLGLGMYRVSPDGRHCASVTEYFKRRRLPWRCYQYKCEIEEVETSRRVTAHFATPWRRPWQRGFHSEILIVWSRDSRHVRFRVGGRLRWSHSLSNPEEAASASWEEGTSGLQPHFEFPTGRPPGK